MFSLDVDDPIWDDVGLDEDNHTEAVSVAVPAWLGDEAVRSGIRGLLQLDRVEEEEARLRHELSVLEEWLDIEWRAIKLARDTCVWLYHPCTHVLISC